MYNDNCVLVSETKSLMDIDVATLIVCETVDAI